MKHSWKRWKKGQSVVKSLVKNKRKLGPAVRALEKIMKKAGK